MGGEKLAHKLKQITADARNALTTEVVVADIIHRAAERARYGYSFVDAQCKLSSTTVAMLQAQGFYVALVTCNDDEFITRTHKVWWNFVK